MNVDLFVNLMPINLAKIRYKIDIVNVAIEKMSGFGCAHTGRCLSHFATYDTTYLRPSVLLEKLYI